MAIKLQDKPNTIAPNTDYPYGAIKDNTGSNDGTPVNKLVYDDLHQFFAKIMDAAGIAYNGLPDNFTNGFQYFMALIKLIRTSLSYEDISSSVTVNTAVFTEFGKVIRRYDDKTIDVQLIVTYNGSVAADTLILSGLPHKTVFFIQTRVVGPAGSAIVNLRQNDLLNPGRLYTDQVLPDLDATPSNTTTLGITYSYKIP